MTDPVQATRSSVLVVLVLVRAGLSKLLLCRHVGLDGLSVNARDCEVLLLARLIRNKLLAKDRRSTLVLLFICAPHAKAVLVLLDEVASGFVAKGAPA